MTTRIVESSPSAWSEVFGERLVSELKRRSSGISVLSLDCFDTILWRDTAAPVDVFFDLARAEPFARRAFSASLRIRAEADARDLERVRSGATEVGLAAIYRAAFPDLDDTELQELVQAELAAEIRACRPFRPVLDAIRWAKASGLRVVITSDTYFSAEQLRTLLAGTLPDGLVDAIDRIFCSSEHTRSKADGLFHDVQKALGPHARRMIHVGDNPLADLEPCRSLGIPALHLRHHEPRVDAVLRGAGVAASVLHPAVRDSRSLPSPYRGVLAAEPPRSEGPAILGYAGLGPLMHAFAHHVVDACAELARQGKRPRPLFLMRDGYLPMLACRAVAGPELGQPICVSRFVANAASLRTRNDIEAYLARSAGSKRFDAMMKQLLLSPEAAKSIRSEIDGSRRPVDAFVARILEPATVANILGAASAFRERFLRYLRDRIGVTPGDTVVFVDLGYEGTAQRLLTPVLEQELGVELRAAYLIAARVPGWHTSRTGLLDPSWCDDRTVRTLCKHVAMLENLCSSPDGSVVDYAEDGAPIIEAPQIDPAQSARVHAIQQEALRFVGAAEGFFRASGKPVEPADARVAALGAIGRLMFVPLAEEVAAMEGFRLDMNLATDDSFALFEVERGLASLRRRGIYLLQQDQRTLRLNAPVELRAASLELSLAAMAQGRFALELVKSDLTHRAELLRVMIARGAHTTVVELEAKATHDGFFSLEVPAGRGEWAVGLQLGSRYAWVQVECVELIPTKELASYAEEGTTRDVTHTVLPQGMTLRAGGLYECPTEDAFLFVPPASLPSGATGVFRVVFRPIARRGS